VKTIIIFAVISLVAPTRTVLLKNQPFNPIDIKINILDKD
jgi:hypothetical protein